MKAIGVRAGVVVVAVGLTWAIAWRVQHRAPVVTQGPLASAAFVGSDGCAGCHAQEATAWRSSQHAHAIAEASPATVLGRFDGTTLENAGATTTFLRRDGKYLVRTEGADGRPADFEVTHTFGVAPLQQYLVTFPDGRRQALRQAWDARPPSVGGNRWFQLYSGQRIPPNDPLHWTGIEQNWNFMCADCHSTNVRKGYDGDARTFATTWSEISVGCEACHGAGSLHVEQARGLTRRDDAFGWRVRLDERRAVSWTVDAATGAPVRSRPRTSDHEIDTCARCHARRSQLTDVVTAGNALEQAFRPSVIEPGLYHPDGQQRDEVYTYGSFLQSKMHASGVTCSDCHEPHSGALRRPGNATCTQCHSQASFDTPAHHRHTVGSPAAACTTCHMPTTTYMSVDPRHDHSFRVPRPDRTVAIGVPNACTAGCHLNRSAAWAANVLARRQVRPPDNWFGFAEAFASFDRAVTPASSRAVLAIAVDASRASIVRASALVRLARGSGGEGAPFEALLSDTSPLVRRAALGLLRTADAGTRLRLGLPLLSDPVRTVRTEAVMALVDVADRAIGGDAKAGFDRAFDEAVAEQRFNGDRPEAQVNLASLWLMRGRLDEATAALQEAIRLDRTFVPAYVNLADVYRQRGQEERAHDVLRQALTASPANGPTHHALGLALVRQRRTTEALVELREAARLDPANPRYSYVYAVALHDTGDTRAALAALGDAVARHPDDRDTLYALALYSKDAGLLADARGYAARLLRRDPGDQAARELAATIR